MAPKRSNSRKASVAAAAPPQDRASARAYTPPR
jgi:hypothetical protein